MEVSEVQRISQPLSTWYIARIATPLIRLKCVFLLSGSDRNMSAKFQEKSQKEHESKWRPISYTTRNFHGNKGT